MKFTHKTTIAFLSLGLLFNFAQAGRVDVQKFANAFMSKDIDGANFEFNRLNDTDKTAALAKCPAYQPVQGIFTQALNQLNKPYVKPVLGGTAVVATVGGLGYKYSDKLGNGVVALKDMTVNSGSTVLNFGKDTLVSGYNGCTLENLKKFSGYNLGSNLVVSGYENFGTKSKVATGVIGAGLVGYGAYKAYQNYKSAPTVTPVVAPVITEEITEVKTEVVDATVKPSYFTTKNVVGAVAVTAAVVGTGYGVYKNTEAIKNGAVALKDMSVNGAVALKDMSVNGTIALKDMTVNSAIWTKDTVVSGLGKAKNYVWSAKPTDEATDSAVVKIIMQPMLDLVNNK